MPQKKVRPIVKLGADAFLAQLATPAGFAREAVTETWPGESAYPGVQFVGHDGKTTIKILITNVKDDYLPGTGHTSFVTTQGSFSFDRRGVDDSFYVDAEDTPADVDAKVTGQIDRVLASRDRHARSEKVPFVGHVVTPEQKAKIAATLKAGRTHDFTPSGFGVGYAVSTKKRSRWAQPAPQAMADFFGTPRLYFETLDCD